MKIFELTTLYLHLDCLPLRKKLQCSIVFAVLKVLIRQNFGQYACIESTSQVSVCVYPNILSRITPATPNHPFIQCFTVYQLTIQAVFIRSVNMGSLLVEPFQCDHQVDWLRNDTRSINPHMFPTIRESTIPSKNRSTTQAFIAVGRFQRFQEVFYRVLQKT